MAICERQLAPGELLIGHATGAKSAGRKCDPEPGGAHGIAAATVVELPHLGRSRCVNYRRHVSYGTDHVRAGHGQHGHGRRHALRCTAHFPTALRKNSGVAISGAHISQAFPTSGFARLLHPPTMSSQSPYAQSRNIAFAQLPQAYRPMAFSPEQNVASTSSASAPMYINAPSGPSSGFPQASFQAPAHKHAHHLHSIPPREKSTRTLIIDHMLWVHGQ